MSDFISYAQNCEDIRLWLTLRDVEHGFYVDCGACDPVSLSVTKAFYDRGWRGINIEPLPQLIAPFEIQRPRDINLSIGAGDHEGEVVLHEIINTGLSTVNAAYASKHEDSGLSARDITIKVRRLADILAEAGNPEVHFLKIDVEGAEKAVLEGADFKKHRPWIVLVEAVEPMSIDPSTTSLAPHDTSASWEPILIQANYQFAHFDGLNRFYVAAEHAELKPALATNPNLLLWWTRHDPALEKQLSDATGTIAQLQETIRQRDEMINDMTADKTRAEAEIARLTSLVLAIHRSLSWRLTKPLRDLTRQN